MKKTIILKILLAYSALGHFLIGLAAIAVPPGGLADLIIEITYGSSFEIDPTTHHIIRILGVFMVALGILTVFAVYDPRRYVAVIYVLLFVFVVRSVQRLILASEIQEYFGSTPSRLIGQSLFLITLGIAMLVLRPRHDASS